MDISFQFHLLWRHGGILQSREVSFLPYSKRFMNATGFSCCFSPPFVHIWKPLGLRWFSWLDEDHNNTFSSLCSSICILNWFDRVMKTFVLFCSTYCEHMVVFMKANWIVLLIIPTVAVYYAWPVVSPLSPDHHHHHHHHPLVRQGLSLRLLCLAGRRRLTVVACATGPQTIALKVRTAQVLLTLVIQSAFYSSNKTVRSYF